MIRTLLAVSVAATSMSALAANPPAMTASNVINMSAAGAVAAANCVGGSADEHRRNARDGAMQMLQARHMLPKDFDAQFKRAYDVEASRMKAKSAAERKAVCARLEAQGVHFNAAPPKH